MLATFNEQFRQGVSVTKVVALANEIPMTLFNYKNGMSQFSEKLQECERTPDGYARVFGRVFSEEPTLSVDNNSWQSFTNTSIQYVSAARPDNTEPLLVRRMHYISFASMFRSDLYEGLCVGHAPRKCAVCGKWFLTTDARHTKYCSGYAPNDKRGRTCRQVGNLRGREQRELAADHPIKRIYTKRFNTITQYLGRGTLDEQTAAVMKKLAKRKLERAIREPDYAQGSYAAEMEQETEFLKYAKHYIWDGLLFCRMMGEAGSFSSLAEYRRVRQIGAIYNNSGKSRAEVVSEFAAQSGYKDESVSADELLTIARRNRSIVSLYRTEQDEDGEETGEDVTCDDSWNYADILWNGIHAKAVAAAFDQLS